MPAIAPWKWLNLRVQKRLAFCRCDDACFYLNMQRLHLCPSILFYANSIFKPGNFRGMTGKTPQVRTLEVQYRDRSFHIEYFHRPGDDRTNKKTLILLHGLGGAKENYWEACKTKALSGYTLIAPDNPGTGNSNYYADFALNVDDLKNITALFIEAIGINDFILVGTSMGGLTALLYLRDKSAEKVSAFINIEGNLMPEDCMFSSKVIAYEFDFFSEVVFPATITDMKSKGNPGYHMIANNLQLNTNVKAYYDYSFQTVEYSADGELLKQYMSLPVPRLFIYGDQENHLSYIPVLKKNKMNVAEISKSNHFVFYDNPKALYDVMAEFINNLL
jgi:pimeloyl-ACP methyl ester carboxylesterase